MNEARRIDVRGVVRTAGRIFKGRGLTLAWPMMFAAFGVMIAFTVIGLPVCPWMLGVATFESLGMPWLRKEKIKIGLVALLAPLPSIGACWVGVRILHTSVLDWHPAVAALVIAIAASGTAAVTPVIGAAASLARCGGTVPDALGRSILRCAQLGPASSLLGAMYGAALVSPSVLALLVCRALFADSSGARVWVGLVIVIGGALAIAGGTAALSLGAALGEPVLDDAAPPRVLSLIAVPVLALAATVALVLLVPAPMWTPVPHTGRLSEGDRRAAPIRVQEREHAVVDVFVDEHRASWVRLPANHYVDWQDAGWPLVSGMEDGRFVVATWGPDARFFLGATFDAQGHRLDDEVRDRLAARIDLSSLVLMALALVLAAAAIVRGQRALRATTNGPLVIDVVVRGGATRLESIDGATVFSIDRALPSLCTTPLVDGARARMVTTRAAALGPRQGASPAPNGAWLLDADIEPTSARAMFAARRVAVPALVAVLAWLAAGSCMLMLL